MAVEDLLVSMRSGEVQSDASITAFVSGVTSAEISRPQAAAWLAWAFMRGLSDRETVALTRAMTNSGQVMTWDDGATLVDKHSTGGVGDKVSLILAPLWAELGMRVPMISGRGLGHTGGTLDKLEAIEGYRCDRTEQQLRRQLNEVGCFISGQTSELAPADRVLYALRNETSTVESIPLIVGSILSKKLAEGVSRLVLDVKTGSGAFMQRLDDARQLAQTLVRVAREAGLDCQASITAMDRPLGRAIGNAVEVEEAIACLKGEGPSDLVDIVLALADHPRAADLLASGAAFPRFERMVVAQGGSLQQPLRGAGVSEHQVRADRSGLVGCIDARGVGRAAFALGAGRRRASDPVDFGVGVLLRADLGDRVAAGDVLGTVLHRNGHCLEEAVARLSAAIVVAESPPSALPLIIEQIA